MSRLLKSYHALGVQPGAPLTVALRRYRWLAHAFHPDRFVESRRATAEVEMKRLNEARETLREHFAQKHQSATEYCDCDRQAKIDEQRSYSVRKDSSESTKFGEARTSTNPADDQSRRVKLISDARAAYRKDDHNTETRKKSDRSTESFSQAVWQRRSGDTKIDPVRCAGRVAVEEPSSPDTRNVDDNKKLPMAGKAQPIVLPQWFLVVMALIFFTMAMSVNRQESLSTQYGGDTVNSQ